MKRKLVKSRAIILIWIIAIVTGMGAYAQSIVPQKDEKKGLWGYVSKSDGKWVVKPKFDEATELTASPNGQLRGTVTLKDKKGFIDDSGKILGAGIIFEEITPMQGDAMFVKVKGKTGVADYSGVYKVKPEAENVEQLGDEGWIVTMKGKKGLLKNDGTWLVQPLYTGIDASVPGYFIIKSGEKAGLLKRDGSSIVEPKDYTGFKPYNNKYWLVDKKGKKGLIETASGKIFITPDYDGLVGLYLNEKANIFTKGNKIHILNEYGKRKASFSYSGDIKITEMPNRKYLFVNSSGKGAHIYLCDYNKAYPITYKSDKFHGFDRLEIDYAPYHYYYSEDKEALKPYIGHVKYYSPDGRNDYYSGGDINDYLYYMRGRNGRDDLYLVGDNKCLGEIDGEFNGSKNAFNKLVSGQYVDSEGNLYEPIIVDGNVVALRNLMTGKYSIVKKINGLLEKQGGILYDELITNNSFYPRGFVGKTGNKAYWLSPSGRIEAEFSKDSTVQVDSFTIMDINGKFGIKKDGKIILEPNYDSITNVEFYDIDDDRPYDTKYRMVKKGDKVGLFDEDKAKIVIPLERGYSNICGEKWNYKATNRFEDSDLICVFTGDKENPAVGVWNLKLGKEVLKPSADNKIEYLPKGYKGYYNNNVAYSPAGSKLNLSPAIDVYQAEWGNGSPYFFTKMVGLEGRTIDFYITAYAPNGSVYKDRSGQKCIYKFSQSETPNSQIEYGPKVVHYAEGDVYLKPFSSITIKYVLSAKDAKTGASIPVKGEKSISMTFSRDW